MTFIFFIGRFHVLALHLPITLILLAVLVEWLARNRPALRGALPLLWAAAAITAILTATLGYMHFAEGGFTGSSALTHRLLGTTLAVLTTGAWCLRMKAPSVFNHARIVVGIVLVTLVTLTGHFGGNLTHGETFLVEYAPNPIRRMLGLEEMRGKVTDVAQADPYLDIVRPIFAQRCFGCHNADKQRGGLNLSSYATAIKGGKDGQVIVPGSAEKSDLSRRISLSHDNADFMPAEGKTPLTDSQTAVIRWWIQSGARTGVRVSQLAVPQDTLALLTAQLGIGAQNSQGGAAPTAEAKPADPALIAQLEHAGFAVRQRSISDAALVVRPAKFGATLTPQQLAALTVAAGQIVELSLQRTNIEDDAIANLGKLTQLTRLRLDGNKLDDSGLSKLGPMPKLTSLNLYGNSGITDASVHSLAALPALKDLYVWGTGITPAGIEQLKQLRPALYIEAAEAAVPPAQSSAPAVK